MNRTMRHKSLIEAIKRTRSTRYPFDEYFQLKEDTLLEDKLDNGADMFMGVVDLSAGGSTLYFPEVIDSYAQISLIDTVVLNKERMVAWLSIIKEAFDYPIYMMCDEKNICAVLGEPNPGEYPVWVYPIHTKDLDIDVNYLDGAGNCDLITDLRITINIEDYLLDESGNDLIDEFEDHCKFSKDSSEIFDPAKNFSRIPVKDLAREMGLTVRGYSEDDCKDLDEYRESESDGNLKEVADSGEYASTYNEEPEEFPEKYLGGEPEEYLDFDETPTETTEPLTLVRKKQDGSEPLSRWDNIPDLDGGAF